MRTGFFRFSLNLYRGHSLGTLRATATPKCMHHSEFKFRPALNRADEVPVVASLISAPAGGLPTNLSARSGIDRFQGYCWIGPLLHRIRLDASDARISSFELLMPRVHHNVCLEATSHGRSQTRYV